MPLKSDLRLGVIGAALGCCLLLLLLSACQLGSDSSATQLVKAINVGGPRTTYDGIEFETDTNRFNVGGQIRTTVDDIAGTTEDALFQSERWGNFSYAIPVTNATYDVRLYFVEMHYQASGKRVFSVSVEGKEVLPRLDLFEQVGSLTRFMHVIEDVEVTDQELNIELKTPIHIATLSGFAIYSVNGEFVEPPWAPPITPIPAPEQGRRSAENPSADCEVANVPVSFDNAKLPDPFIKIDGTRVTSKDQWRCRRQEILRIAELEVFGVKPQPPAAVSGEIVGNTATIRVADEGKTTSFEVSLTMPEGEGPFPAVISFNALDTQVFIDEGVAVIKMNPYDLGSQASRATKTGAFYDLYGANSTTGVLVAWSWGASRVIDFFEQQAQAGGRLINPERFAVTGCSGFGKGAFAAGVFDARIDLTIPMESGTGGTAAWRSVVAEPGAQPLTRAYDDAPWLGDAFKRYHFVPNRIPIDTHALIGTIAPRGLLILEQAAADWLALTSSHLAAQAGAKIYQALGAGDALTYIATNGTHHCEFSEPWRVPLRANIGRFLQGQDIAAGGITPAPGKAAELSEWIDWDTPSLSGKLDLK